jgi:4-amino-4-deoxy-L-arabinose transferase-like glycosyltransferase
VVIPLSRIPHRIAVPALLALFAVSGWLSFTRDSATFDETAHLGAGVSYLETGDFRLNPEHPPLVKLLAAMPLVLLHRGGGNYDSPAWMGTPVGPDDALRSHAEEWGFGFELVNGPRSGTSRRDPAARLTPARLTVLALGVLLALVVYAWARALWGPPAGLLALALTVTCPTLLAQTRIVTTDLPAALGFTGTAWLVWRWLSAPSSPRRAFAAGAALGAALLFKFSCLLLVPVIVIVAAIAVASRRLTVKRAAAGVGLIAATAYLALWAGYGFRFAASRDPGYVLEWRDFEADFPTPPAIVFAREHRLLPEAYLFGFAFAKSQSLGRVAFLDGELSLAGWLRYFPEAFLLKTPLAFTALSLWLLATGVRRTRGRSFDGWCLALPPLVFAVVAVSSRFNIGHRDVTPLYPFLCIAIAPAASWLEKRGARAVAVAVLVVSCFVSFALATPRYLSYFNVVAGGPRGGTKHLVDSNIDWGQDLIRLKGWMSAHGVAEVDLAYFGTADPRAYDIAFRKVALFIDFYPDLPITRPESGHYLAASVTLLTGIYLNADRTFANELLRRRFAERSEIEAYLDQSVARAERGDSHVPLADWMTERGMITADERRAAETDLPAAWLRDARDTLTPVGWAGDSIAIYRIP